MINNNASLKKPLHNNKTSYYRRFIDSRSISSNRFIPSVNTDSNIDSGEMSKEALDTARKYAEKPIEHIRRFHAAYNRAYQHTNRKPDLRADAPGTVSKRNKHLHTANRFQSDRAKTRYTSKNGSVPAMSEAAHSMQKQHIKKEYQKKALAAATIIAPETAAASAAISTSAKYTSAGNKDGSIKKMITAIITVCFTLLVIMPAGIAYTAASLIEPISIYLDTIAEDYRSGFNGDGTSEIITDAANSPVTEEALNNPAFAALINEAEKYLGYPYVWGGSSPSTSFDCSGFVSWVYRESGYYDMQRMTAQNIFNISTPVTYEDVHPGDLIFFTGTYSSNNPVTHVGIYVGEGYMIHAGDPIQYTSINTEYWTSHFYAYGRLAD